MMTGTQRQWEHLQNQVLNYSIQFKLPAYYILLTISGRFTRVLLVHQYEGCFFLKTHNFSQFDIILAKFEQMLSCQV